MSCLSLPEEGALGPEPLAPRLGMDRQAGTQADRSLLPAHTASLGVSTTILMGERLGTPPGHWLFISILIFTGWTRPGLARVGVSQRGREVWLPPPHTHKKTLEQNLGTLRLRQGRRWPWQPPPLDPWPSLHPGVVLAKWSTAGRARDRSRLHCVQAPCAEPLVRTPQPVAQPL